MLIGCLKAGCMYSLSHSTHRRIVNNCQLIVDGIVSTETVHFVLFVCLFVFFLVLLFFTVVFVCMSVLRPPKIAFDYICLTKRSQNLKNRELIYVTLS